MSCLFKHPVVIVKESMAWINFDHTQSNSTKWPKKTKIPQNEISSRKTTNKIFMYLLGGGNLIFCGAGIRENYFGLIGRQNNNNIPKFQR